VKHSHFLLSDVISKRITFSQPFPPPSDPPADDAPWFFFKISALYKSFTYLLTYLLKSANPDRKGQSVAAKTCSELQKWRKQAMNTLSDFHAWFLVYWASTSAGSARDNNTSGSLSALVRDPRKNALLYLLSHGHCSAALQHYNLQQIKIRTFNFKSYTLWYHVTEFAILSKCTVLLHYSTITN